MTTPTSNQYLPAARRFGSRGSPAYISGLSPLRYPDTTNLGLWLDADAITALNSGDRISTWSDKSGNGRNAVQTSTTRPFYEANARNGRGGVWFNGSTYSAIVMTTPAWGATVGTAYLVLHQSVFAAATPFGWSDRSDEYWWYAANTSYIGMMRHTRLEGASINFTAGTHVVTVLSGASAYNVYDNGATLYTGSADWAGPTNANVGNNIGGNAAWVGFIYEVLIYSAEHTADQRQSIWNYLRWKWGVG